MLASRIAMTLLLTVGLGAFAWIAARRWKLMFAAQGHADRSDRMGRRIANVFYYMFGQARMFRYRAAGIAHAFIFGGFVVLGLRTLVLIARGFTTRQDFGFWLFDDHALLGQAYLFFKDIVGVLVIAGVLYFLYLRLVTQPKRIELSGEGILILLLIMGLMFADLAYEGSGIALGRRAGGDGFHALTPASSVFSYLLGLVPSAGLGMLRSTGFWLHTAIVLAFLNFLPFGKHFHIITVLPNVLTSNTDRIGLLRGIADIEGKLEREETLGIKTVQDLNWKDVLDLYTCTECGRCSDMCPAFNTGKLLSPKHLTMDLRDHMYGNQEYLIKLPNRVAQASVPASEVVQASVPASLSAGTEARSTVACAGTEARSTVACAGTEARSTDSSGAAAGAIPSSNGDSGAFSLKDDEKFQLMPHIIDPEVIWACTTCGACEQECPVFISYVDKILALRQNAVLEQGAFPDQLQNAFRGLESVGNPYSFDNSQRAEWAQGLDIPLRAEKPDAEYLFWVGCSPSFDDRARRIARATARLLKQAGVDFAILGSEEMCNGDPARRAGNEFLFQTLAKQNIETLNNYQVKKVVTTCPHCFNMLGREYPELGGRYEVIHHTQFLFELVRTGRLKPTHRIDAHVAYHDSCYLGRYHGIYDAPRELLKSIPGMTVHEPAESRSRGMCCGAGGAQMWKEEEPVRRPDSREGDGKVNHARVRQILKVLPSAGPPRKIASACPFCKTMLSDGLADQGHQDVEQRDVAEYLLEAVVGRD